MSVDCSIDGDVEYLDDMLLFSSESTVVQDLMDFSRQVLSLDTSHSVDVSDVSGNTTPRGTQEEFKLSNHPRTTFNSRDFKKKHRRAIPGKHTTVAKNDLRRGYAQMYIDALNSGSIPFFKKSLLDFCMPECVLVTRNVSPTGMVFPSYVETLGVNAVTVLYEAFIKSTPDVAFELHSSTIRVYADGTSTIVGKFTMIATKVFALAGLEENGNHKVVLSLDPMDELTSKFGKATLTAKITSTVDDPVSGLQTEIGTETKVSLGAVHKDKAKISVIGTIHMFLNTEKKAIKIMFSQWNESEQKAEAEKAIQGLVGSANKAAVKMAGSESSVSVSNSHVSNSSGEVVK